MKTDLIRLFVYTISFFPFLSGTAMAETPFYSQSAVTIDGKTVNMDAYKGKVALIVNTASKCGFTPQYHDLEELYKKYADNGFLILGFPSNDFGNQEPGSNTEIKKFCTLNYNVTFPMFQKIDVTGENIHPLFRYLTQFSPDEFTGEIKWNFEKFLIDKKGNVRARFGSAVNPLSSKITNKVEELLKEN